MPTAARGMYRNWVKSALTTLGPSRPKAVYEWIKSNEAVPSDDLAELTARGESAFEKEVRFTRFDLRIEGVVSDQLGRGTWSLSEGV